MKPKLYRTGGYWYCEYYMLNRKFLVAGYSPAQAYNRLVRCIENL